MGLLYLYLFNIICIDKHIGMTDIVFEVWKILKLTTCSNVTEIDSSFRHTASAPGQCSHGVLIIGERYFEYCRNVPSATQNT